MSWNSFTYLHTYCMVKSPSWEANCFAAIQEISRISPYPKVHYRTHKRPPPVSILGQPNPVHIPASHLLEIHPNIIHPSTPRSPQWSLSLLFPQQDPIHPPLLTHTRHMFTFMYIIQNLHSYEGISLHHLLSLVHCAQPTSLKETAWPFVTKALEDLAVQHRKTRWLQPVTDLEEPNIPTVRTTSVRNLNLCLPERESSVKGSSRISMSLLVGTQLTRTVSCHLRTPSVILGAPELDVESEQMLVAAVLQHRRRLSLCDDVNPTHLLNVCGTPSLDRPVQTFYRIRS